ncbi:MAG: hypothetical protein ACYC7D_11450 [Nitrososphaerales archaeon]
MAQEAQIQTPEEAHAPQKTESDFAISIKSLQEESLQISELTEMERTYGAEVITSLKQVIEPLNVSYHVKPGSISKADSTLSDVILTPQGVVCLIHNNGTVNSKTLESLQSETLVKILAEIIPEVRSLLVDKRQKISGRVGMLEKVAREFRKVASTLPTRQRSLDHQLPAREKQPSSDALKAALS